jgi:hypothetical protein
MITHAAAVLRWTEPVAGLGRRVELEFEALLHEALLRVWEQPAFDRATVDQPFEEDGTPIEVYRRVLLAPRTVRRLLWPRRDQHAATREYWLAACEIERALSGLRTKGTSTGWTADGRAFVAADGSCIVQPTLDSDIALDLCSPHALALNLSGGDAPADPPRMPPAAQAVQHIASRLLDAWKGICASELAVSRCVADWTRVIIAQHDPSQRFWSGSNGQYVGRVMIVNPDTAKSSTEEIADALVHEAIHGFLYMHESVERWVLGNELYTSVGVIRSPWSGELLPVRPFMQAAFVWYGLAMFWAQHVGGGVFDSNRACAMLERALAGFRRGSLVNRLKPWRAKIRTELIEAIDDLQQDVLSLLRA